MSSTPSTSEWVPAAELQSLAEQVNISSPMLTRLARAGLLAPPDRTSEHGHPGARYRYPVRTLAQLTRIADARKWRRDEVSLRHHVWWTSGELENWTLWRADRIAELEIQAQYGREFAAMEPDDRDAVVVEFADLMPRLVPSRKTALGAIPVGALQTVATLFLNSTVRDLDALLADRESGDWPLDDVPAFRAVLEENLALPIDGIDGGPSVGSTLATAMGMPRDVPHAGLMTALSLYAFMPDQRDAAGLMRALTEARAAELQDLAVTFQIRGALPNLGTEPELAGLVLLFLDRVQTAAPGISAIPRTPRDANVLAVPSTRSEAPSHG